jgi:hypothetical protein
MPPRPQSPAERKELEPLLTFFFIRGSRGLRRNLLTIWISRTGFDVSAPGLTAIAMALERMLLHVRALATPTSSLIFPMTLLTRGVDASASRTSPMRGRMFFSRPGTTSDLCWAEFTERWPPWALDRVRRPGPFSVKSISRPVARTR